MCVPGCAETVLRRLSRRKFLAGAATALAGAAAASCTVVMTPPAESAATAANTVSFSRVIALV